jgi:hypothetical protein
MLRVGEAGPEKPDPGDVDVVADVVAFGPVSPSPRKHGLEKFDTFRVCGEDILVLFPVLCHREDKEVATLRVVGVTLRMVTIRAGDPIRFLFISPAGLDYLKRSRCVLE